jgi:hypothetical protein
MKSSAGARQRRNLGGKVHRGTKESSRAALEVEDEVEDTVRNELFTTLLPLFIEVDGICVL